MSFRPLAVLVSLAAFIPLSLAGSAPQVPSNCALGFARGHWNLPSSVAGEVRGALVAPNGQPVLRLRAQLVPNAQPSLLPNGALRGMLVLPPAPGEEPQPVAFLRGHWVLGPQGVGRFEAMIVRPMPMPTVVGRITGRFADNPDPNEIGEFRALWVACP